MPTLSDIPIEVLLDNVLPSVRTADVLALGSTSRFFTDITNDDTFWKRRIQSDFNFDVQNTARNSGWKFIYRGLRHPKTFVWGERSWGRLGVDNIPREYLYAEGVPAPMEIKIPGKRIVSLVPGGTSFHALDTEGELYVWGTLNGGSWALSSDGFSESNKKADTPHRLLLPGPIRSVTTGRFHTVALTATLDIYTFLSWGRPYRMVTDLLSKDPHSPDAPVQIECGWAFSAVLTHGGRVLVWWPFNGALKQTYDEQTQAMEEQIRQGETRLRAPASNGEVHCHLWDVQTNPFLLPDIPANLPILNDTGEAEEVRKKDPETRLIKIAGADNMLIGLTNRGHVLKYGHLAGEHEYRQSSWQYLAEWSEVECLKKNPAYGPVTDARKEALEAPSQVHITHISAHFDTFVAYSVGTASVVLMSFNDASTEVPKIIPALQNRGIISVVLGDYFKAALTASGKLLTWGQYSKGALGLGHPVNLSVGSAGGFQTERQLNAARENGPRALPPDVNVPTEVRFDWGKKRKEHFCFLAGAAGWHMGALVADLEPEVEEETDDEHVRMPGAFAPVPEHRPIAPFPGPLEGQAPPIIPMLQRGRAFRIGLAGARGRGRGGSPHGGPA